ncbi:glycoside hydrolase family 2 protein [Persicobacter psychrovividus]
MKRFFSILMLIVLQVASTYAQGIDYPRHEYPRPQFERELWMNLNGKWTYKFDFNKEGLSKNYASAKGFDKEITVPFAPESKLSGVEYKDFIPAMWYHRKIKPEASWRGQDVLLNFGAVDYYCQVFINGQLVGKHWGGSTSFSMDISNFVTLGEEADLVVYVEDDTRSKLQATGKQCHDKDSRGCFYSRTTGIWQTVWMEPVYRHALNKVQIIPDLDNKQFVFRPTYRNLQAGTKLRIRVREDKRIVGEGTFAASDAGFCVIPLRFPKTWSPENPFLYEVYFDLFDADGKQIDNVFSYAGMRKVHIEGNRVFLNNELYYQRLVLDQGFYPDGGWTAPSDDELKADIQRGKLAGFNGARMHQKVFEQRYLHWAARLGYLVWGESANWGMDNSNEAAVRNFLSEWTSIVERDINEPAIVAWTPFNETWRPKNLEIQSRMQDDVYDLTKALDPTRPVVTASGGIHAEKEDVYAEHTYKQDPMELYNQLSKSERGVYIKHEESADYAGQPYMVDEFGGIRWLHNQQNEGVAKSATSWGYGTPPQTKEEFYKRLEDQVNVILSLDNIWGFCYTQLTDVEQEQNGLFSYDRESKFDLEKLNKIFSKSREEAKKEVEKMLKDNSNALGK